MYRIEKLLKQDYDAFTEMFCDYFIYDCEVKCDRDKLKSGLINKTILTQYESGLIFIDVIKHENCLGFIIYQIDKEESDWKERIGSGFIREFYIQKEYRKKGLGSLLLKNAEKVLKECGASEVYLTSDEHDYVKKFYEKNGYITNNSRAKNGNEYFEKELS